MLAHSGMFDKVQIANQKEEDKLRQRIDGINKERAESLFTFKTMEQEMSRELETQRLNDFKQEVQKQMQRMQEENKGRNVKAGRKHLTIRPRESRGFSKVNLDEDDDTCVYWQHLKSKSLLQATEARNAEKLDAERTKKETSVISGELNNEVFVHYPVSSFPLQKRSLLLGEPDYSSIKVMYEGGRMREFVSWLATRQASVKQIRPYAKRKCQSAPANCARRLKSAKPTTPRLRKAHSAVQRSSTLPDDLPSYIHVLEKIQHQTFDQHTDGTMGLEMRRLLQRQREKFPAPVGHLPVRRRFYFELFDDFKNRDVLFKHLNAEVGDRIAGERRLAEERGRALTTPGSVKMQTYRKKVPKSHSYEEDQKEYARMLRRLRRMDIIDEYDSALRKAEQFLGEDSGKYKLEQRPERSAEDDVMRKILHTKPKAGPAVQTVRNRGGASRNER